MLVLILMAGPVLPPAAKLRGKGGASLFEAYLDVTK